LSRKENSTSNAEELGKKLDQIIHRLDLLEKKDGGLPEPVAVKMTEEYMRTFTSLGDMLRSAGKGRWSHDEGDEISKEIHKRFREKFQRSTDKEEEEE